MTHKQTEIEFEDEYEEEWSPPRPVQPAGMFPTFHALRTGQLRLSPSRLFRLPWPSRTTRRKLRRGLLFFLLSFLALHATFNTYAAIVLNRELAALRQNGEPLRLGELAPPTVPPAQNAALLYLQVIKTRKDDSKNDDAQVEMKLADEQRKGQRLSAAGRAYLQRNRGALELIRQATEKPGCNFGVDWNQSPHQILFPHYARMRGMARLLSYHAIEAARSGDTAGALRDTRAIFRMANHLNTELTLINFLVSAALNAIGQRTLGTVLQTAQLTAEQARTWEASLPRTDWDAAYHRVMLGERAFSLWNYTAPADFFKYQLGGSEEYSPTIPNWLVSPLVFIWSPALKLDQVYSLRLWQKSIARITPMQVPAPQNYDLIADQEMEEVPPYALFTRILHSVFSRARDNRDRIEVYERQRTVALALAVYRTRYGRYPATLQDAARIWGKPLPLDVYSDTSFPYKTDGRTYSLYSIGINRKDDKGSGRLGIDPRQQTEIDGDDMAWMRAQEY